MSEEQSESQAAESTDSSEEEKYNLVFFPQMEEGSVYEEVRDKLADTLKVDKLKVDAWYDADAPTILLKRVEKDIAERYMEAIMQCGGACNIQPSSQAGGLSLVPKSKNVDFFICPSCEYEEEIARGTKYEQCPKCGLVIEKWEQKMREEAEKEKIRRRLAREQRHASDREEDIERKKAELERLRKLEAEIMKELGIKPPSKLWLIFEKHPFSISGAFSILLIAAAGLGFQQADRYLEAQQAAAQASAPPSEAAQEITPVITAAVQLQQNGNQPMMAEMANTTALMHGSGGSREEIVKAAQQMMKGVEPEKFLQAASKNMRPGVMTRPGPEGQEPQRINTDTLGGIKGIEGIEKFEPDVLADMAPPLLEHGQEQILQRLVETVEVPDPLDPAMTIEVEQIDEMDGSMIVVLMKELSKDQEWDRFLAKNVGEFLDAGMMDQASELIDRIKNPVTKIESLGDYMVAIVADDPTASLKLQMARVYNEVDDITNPDSKAKVLLALGQRLAEAGYADQPDESISRVRTMIRDARSPYEKSYLSSRLAIAELARGNNGQAKSLLQAAENQAGAVPDVADRISAFTRVAQRYYDARNPTLANEILSEAQILAASRLEPADRSRIFGEVAIAQGYMGDIEGAMISIENAGKDVARQQLMAKLAEFLIGLERFYEAQLVMSKLEDPIEFNRLDVRLITALLYAGEDDQVKLRLESAFRNVSRVEGAAERGILMAQFGRIARRAGLNDRADLFFEAAKMQADVLEGRELAINLGLLGLEQARALMLYSSQETMFGVEEAIVRDPVSTEILATERTVNNLMPASVKALIEPEPEY